MRITVFISLLLFSCAALAQKSTNLIAKGNELYKKGDYKQAIEAYEKVLHADKTNGLAQFNDGNALQKTGNYADAGKLFQSVLENTKDPALQSKSSYNKGLAEVKQQQLQEAVNSFKQSLRLNPSDEEARDNLQKALNELKKQQDKKKPDENKNRNNKDNKQQKPKPENKISKQQAENLLNQLRQEEKQLQEAQKQKIKQQVPDKDW